MRIIDADELKKIIEVAIKDSGFYRPIYQGFTKTIDAAPTIDAVPVVRKPVKGYEGYYEVDQFGRIFSVYREIHVIGNNREYDKPISPKQMKQSMHSKGYKIVSLTKNGITHTRFVHRIVAEAFIENPNDLPMVNHKDEDKTNNFVENLEWCNPKYNVNYGTGINRASKKKRGVPHSQEHKNKCSESLKKYYKTHASKSIGRESEKRKPVYAYDLNGNVLCWYPSITCASEDTGVHRANITSVCNGKRKSAKGIVFSFGTYGERKTDAR